MTIPIKIIKKSELKQKAELDQELLVKLVKGLEDIKAGRLKSWDIVKNSD